MAPKRKPRALALDEFDPKLQRVAHALDNLTRTGAPVVTGTSERYPPPGLALKGDDDVDLHCPVSPHDVVKIKARATVPQQPRKGGRGVWEVEGDELELRNPRWHQFLKECFEKLRESLGIAEAATVEISLRKMVLLEAGGRLEARQHSGMEGKDGVFGTLLIVLPSMFKGGNFTFQQDPQDKKTKINWRPGARKNRYDLTYAAFYAHSGYVAEPVKSGAALCLAYDLVTTTPDDVPLYGGSELLKRSAFTALSRFFEVAPASLTKRLKIGPDVWRTINNFVSERHFVHIVGSNTFEGLSEDEEKVAQILAAFCAQSRGQYVLYLAGVLCSRESERYKGYGHHSPLRGGDGDLKLTLKTPWLKYGESAFSKYPPIPVRLECDVTPLGRAEDVELFVEVYDMAQPDYKIVEKVHHNFRKTGVGNTFALVVQPTSVERDQLVKMTIKDATKRIRSLLHESRDEALEYAHRVIAYRTPWRLCYKDIEKLNNFVAAVIELNDQTIFREMLLVINLNHEARLGALRSAVGHFGWNTCADTLVKRILSLPTLRGRVNLINAVLDDSSSAERTDQLLDALLSLHPWTDVKADAEVISSHDYEPDVFEFGRMLTLAASSSHEKMMQVVSVTHPEALIQVVIPALGRLKANLDRALFQSVVPHVSKLFEKLMVVARNEAFAKATLPTHCRNCIVLQSFLSSSAMQATLEYSGTPNQTKHMEAVAKHHLKYPASVRATNAGVNAVRLTKNPGENSYSLYYPAQRAEETLKGFMLPTEEGHKRDRYSWEL